MKIGVLADTHITSVAAGIKLADDLLNGPFAEIEAVIHAGDLVIPEIESCFAPLPWFAVRGNMDAAQINVAERRILDLGSKHIGVIHGWGAPAGIEQRVAGAFKDNPLDVLIFGHSHQPLCKRVGAMLLLNPGSPTDRRYTSCHTVGLLTITEKVHGEIIVLNR